MKRIYDILALTALMTITMLSAAWAGPPGPPVIPTVPVGGSELTMIATAAIAAYGFWKSNK